MKLNIGCGRDIRQGWTNVDVKYIPGVDYCMNLERDGFPKEWQGKARKIYASHVLEHLHDLNRVVQVLWEVAAPGCEMIVKVPHAGSDDAWGDPTHCRAFVEETFWSMGQTYYWRVVPYHEADWQLLGIKYAVSKDRFKDIAPWQVLQHIKKERNAVVEMSAFLVAKKPARKAGTTRPVFSCRREVEYVG